MGSAEISASPLINTRIESKNMFMLFTKLLGYQQTICQHLSVFPFKHQFFHFVKTLINTHHHPRQ